MTAETIYNPADYDRPSVTADAVLFAVRDGGLHVLLVRRKKWPYEGHWALPGGFVQMDESLEEAAQRELFEETGLSGIHLEQIRTFGDPQRDPRMRVITVVYGALVNADETCCVRGGDDAAEARWWSMAALPPLAFDHGQIVSYALQRLRLNPQ